MRDLIVAMFQSVDGFVEGPDGTLLRPEWSGDLEVNWGRANVENAGLLLYGRRAFEFNAGFWPAVEANPNNPEPFREMARVMNSLPKVVFSRTLKEASWNATIVSGDIAGCVQRLKQEDGLPIVAVGGVGICAELIATGLVDEYRFLLNPTIAGGGNPLFRGNHKPLNLQLKSAKAMDTGAVLLTYRAESK